MALCWRVQEALKQSDPNSCENKRINTRELHDALDEKFHEKGGLMYLYELLLRGPIAQGCRLAGLKVPAGAINSSFRQGWLYAVSAWMHWNGA